MCGLVQVSSSATGCSAPWWRVPRSIVPLPGATTVLKQIVENDS